jgi:hypothetical protein
VSICEKTDPLTGTTVVVVVVVDVVVVVGGNGTLLELARIMLPTLVLFTNVKFPVPLRLNNSIGMNINI